MVRERYEAQLAEHPEDKRLENMLAAYDHAKTHPDPMDLEGARSFTRAILKREEER